jgi:uncharacterized protein YecT (DUF1311 family)
MKIKTMNSLRIVLSLICLLAMGSPVHSASFDCNRAQTPVENLICASPEISKLDEDLAEAYGIAMLANPKAEEIKDAQKKWLLQRNACQSVDCLAVINQKRTKDISEIERMQKEGVGDWTYRGDSGRKEPLCHALLSRLNRFDRDESLESRCSFPVIASYPEFSAPPWEDLNVSQHWDLFVKALKYSEEGPLGYFSQTTNVAPRHPDSYYPYYAERSLEAGWRLRLWRVRLANHFRTRTGSFVAALPGEQAIVQLYLARTKDDEAVYCPTKPKPRGVFSAAAMTFIFTPDLDGPDPHVDSGTFATLSGHDLAIYQGNPMLIGVDSIWRDGQIDLDRICSFEYVKGAR